MVAVVKFVDCTSVLYAVLWHVLMASLVCFTGEARGREHDHYVQLWLLSGQKTDG